MVDKVLKWIREEKLIQEHDTVLAGVSGGADSVCLLLLLLEFQKKIDFSLQVIHVEHGIRGEESEADAAFVEELCRKYGVPCRSCREKVPEYAENAGLGLEEAARILRYDCFRREVDALAALSGVSLPVKVALAHHANDNAETILFQMIRGSGLRGLCGMRPSRIFEENAVIIRPLLHVSREEIEEYLAEQGQEFRVDGTNRDTDYSRNRIRQNVMPELFAINSRAAAHMAESGAMLQEISDYLDAQVSELMSVFCRKIGERLQENDFQSEWLQENGIQIEAKLFEQYPSLLQREVILQVIGLVAGSRKDIGAVHVEAVQKLAVRQVGRSITLPYGLCAIRNYEGIRIFRRAECENSRREILNTKMNERFPGNDSVTGMDEKSEEKNSVTGMKENFGKKVPDKILETGGYEIPAGEWKRLEQGEKLTIHLPDACVEMKILDFGGKIPEIHKKKYTKWLNYDKIKTSLQIRKRAAGDYLVIDEKGHKKKLKEYFIEEKIPSEQRTDIWLLAEDSHILWVIGGRISADCKIEKNTERILEVRVIGGNYYED